MPLASPTSTVHQLIVLPFFCGSGSLVSTRPTTSGPVTPPAVQALLLEPDGDEGGRDGLTRGVGRHRDVLAQPVDGNAHQISIPNCASKRTSPSIMSRMSLTPVRNISARSMPMPNANPV